MQRIKVIELFIEHDREGTYFTLPFTMPPDTEKLTLSYMYERHRESESKIGNGSFITRQEINIIDLGLIAPDRTQVGASGSDKYELFLSANEATPGYKPYPLISGSWMILIGAYKVASEGVTVKFELSFVKKTLRLFKGDLHTHTIASDGVLTTEELGWHALRHGLDFVAVTDHNQLISTEALPHIPGITFIPGVEWTHYLGHANFLGIDKPYDSSFAANKLDEVVTRFESARNRGALIILNHPFEEGMGFQFDINTLPFDCMEVWNGPMRESNLRALSFWQSMLANGKKIPITGGSDYHRDSPFQILGGPTTCVYAMSSSSNDILYAIKSGHSYITFAPNGPTLEMTTGEAILGDTVSWAQTKKLQISVNGLVGGDIIQVVTGTICETICESPANGRIEISYTMNAPGFARIEILRSFLPGLPLLPALISNPIYFE